MYWHGLRVLNEIVDWEADRALAVVLLIDVIVGHGRDVLWRNVVKIERIFPTNDVAVLLGQRHGDGAVGVGDDLRLDVPVHLVGLQVLVQSFLTFETSRTQVTLVCQWAKKEKIISRKSFCFQLLIVHGGSISTSWLGQKLSSSLIIIIIINVLKG